MGNEIVSFGELERMAQAVAKSGLFGVKTADQAIALMLVAQAEGRHPALAARDYDIIQGRPAKKAEAMLRDFLESGGKVEWHGLDDTVADATFSHPSGGTVRIEWTMKRAIAAGLGGRDMWKKYPRQMLRSRVVSEGIRTVCPMATSGMYVPEEVSDIVKEKDITPTSGAADRVNPERQIEIKDIVDKVTGWLNSGSVADAVAEKDNAGMDADEYTFFWTFFDSKQRRAMKDEGERQRIDSTKAIESKTISDAARKRLEARISELKLDREAVKAYVAEIFKKDHFVDLTKEEYSALDSHLDSMALTIEPGAKGTAASGVKQADAHSNANSPMETEASDQPAAAQFISAEQIREIDALCEMKGLKGRLSAKLATSKIASIDKIPAAKFDSIIAWIDGAK